MNPSINALRHDAHHEDASPSVVRFEARSVDGKNTPYALVLSSTPGPMATAGGLTVDAQAGFFALENKERRSFDATARLNRSDDALRQEPLVGFVPTAHQESAIAALHRLFERWTQGQDQDLGYFGAGGQLVMGVRFTPSGMLLVVETTMHVALVPGLQKDWQYERLLDSGFTFANVSELALQSMAPNASSDPVPPREFAREASFLKLGPVNNVSHLLAPTPHDDTSFPALNLGPGSTTRLSPAKARNPVVPHFVGFLRQELESRTLNDVLDPRTIGPSMLPRRRL